MKLVAQISQLADASGTQPIPNPLLDQAGFAVPAALEAEIDELITQFNDKVALL